MFQVTVYVGISPIILLYRDEEKAKSNFMTITSLVPDTRGACAKVEDDFGHQLMLPGPGDYPAMFEDLTVSQLGHIEYGMHQARTQAKMQQAATRDPVISTARMGQGPAVLQPGFNGGLR